MWLILISIYSSSVKVDPFKADVFSMIFLKYRMIRSIIFQDCMMLAYRGSQGNLWRWRSIKKDCKLCLKRFFSDPFPFPRSSLIIWIVWDHLERLHIYFHFSMNLSLFRPPKSFLSKLLLLLLVAVCGR